MKIFNLVLLVVATVSINVAHAQFNIGQECIPQSEIKAIATNFRQFANLTNADFCNDDSQTWHLLSSIMFMRKTVFAQNMPVSKDELFSGKFASNWYQYFIGRINNLNVVSDCPKGVIAYVYSFGGKTMYVCPMALTNSFSSLDRASVMMHEARHIDGFPHITCSKGARKGLQGACDVKIADGGSYAVTVETYAQLAKYAEGVHPAMKAYAKSSAIIYAEEAFENPVRINRSQNLLVLSQDLGFHSLNTATGELKKLGTAPAAGHIVKRAQHMILFPADKTLKAGYVFSNDEGTISQSPSDFVTEYNAQTPAQKADLVDLHIGAQWSARVFKNKVTFICDPTSPATRDIALPAGETAASLIYPDGYARDKYTAQLLTESGNVLEVGCVNRQASLKSLPTKFSQKITHIHQANGQVFVVGDDAKLYRLESGRFSPVSTALDGGIIDIVPQDSFEFFQ